MIVLFVLVHQSIRGAKFMWLMTFNKDVDHLLLKSSLQGCLGEKKKKKSFDIRGKKVVVSFDQENGLEYVNVEPVKMQSPALEAK